jgi:hypothetical protein
MVRLPWFSVQHKINTFDTINCCVAQGAQVTHLCQLSQLGNCNTDFSYLLLLLPYYETKISEIQETKILQ